MTTLLRKLRLRRLRSSFEELLREYTRDTGKAANEVFMVDILQWIIKQDNIGKLS